MAKPPAGFIARAMCALAAASLIAAPVLVSADAGAPKHKVHKKAPKKGKVCKKYKTVYKNGKKRRVCGAYLPGSRSAGSLPKTTTVTMTTTTTTPAPPPPPPPSGGYAPNLGFILGGTALGFGVGALIGDGEKRDSNGG